MSEGTDRINAFSDGVFAIAVTLLILEIRLPHAQPGQGLASTLLSLWPSFVAFGLSFFVILVTWISHHAVMRLVHETDIPIKVANGVALAYVTFIPFPTAVLAENLGGPQVGPAVAFYCGTFVFGSAAFNVLVETISRSGMLRPGVTPDTVGQIRHGFRITLGVYSLATVIAFFAPYLALLLNVGVRLHLLRVHSQRTATAARPAGQAAS